MACPFIIGAYASHPASELEADYYQLLADQPWVAGVEIPYPGQLATQLDVLASHLSPHWDFNTITAIPGTMQNVWKDENFGLASPDEAGREAALAFTRRLCDDLDDLCDKAGRLLVGRVQLHSAPTRLANADAFKRSLEDVLGWDWCGATLVVEHCDAYIPGQNPEKGFLSLAGEIDIVAELGVGIHLNWAAPPWRGAARRLPSSMCARPGNAGCSTASCSRVPGRRRLSTGTPGSTDICPLRPTSRPPSWTPSRSDAARRQRSRAVSSTSERRSASPRMPPSSSASRC